MKLIAGVLMICCFAATTLGQNTGAGTPPFSSLTGGTPFDVVNNQDVNVHLNITFMGLAGRHTGFAFSEINDSLVWVPVNSGGTTSWMPVVDFNGNPTWGWQTGNPTGTMSYVFTTIGSCLVTIPPGIQVNDPLLHLFNMVYTDSRGTPHRFPTVDLTDTCVNNQVVRQPTNSGDGFVGYASDASGYRLNFNTLTTSPTGVEPTGVVTGSDGVQYYGFVGLGYVEDANGNFISNSFSSPTTTWKDTTGSTALTVTNSSNALTYKDRSGNTIATVNLQTINIKTNFGCSGIVEYSGTATVPSSISFPNNQTINFSYEPTPGNSGFFTGRLQKATFPNGGFYEYDYGATNDGINCSDGTTMSLTRKINDGTSSHVWTFSRSGSTTTVSAPQLSYDSVGNDTVYGFDGSGHETSRKIYEGSAGAGTLLQTRNTTWASNGTPSTAVIILDDGKTQSETDTSYDSNGLIRSTSQFDFGSGGHGSLIKSTSYSYLADTNNNYAGLNLINLVSSVTIKGSDGIAKSQMGFGYDENQIAQSLCPTSVAQHDDNSYGCGFNFRGNVTSVKSYKDPVTPANPVTKSFTYDVFGNTRSAQLNCCQQKTWSFSATTNYSFADSVTRGSAPGTQLTTSYVYNGPSDGPTGLLKSLTDENSQVTQYVYDSVGRIKTVTRPDTTQVSYSYDDTNHKITIKTPIDSSHSVQEVRAADSLGRLLTTTLEDGSGNVSSIVQSQYDELGRPSSQSNPYTGSPSFFTSTQFDALGRPTKTIFQDGQKNQYSYSAQAITVTDPTGKQIERRLDGIGRIVEVDEPNTSLVGGGATASVTLSGSLNSTTTMGSASVIAATNSALTSFVASDGSSHTFYLDSNRHVNHVFWNSSGGWQVQDVSAIANNVLAASGSPLTSLATSDGNYHVFYLDANSHVNQLAGSLLTWSNQDITSAAGAAAAASNSKLASFTNSAGNHVYYLGTNQHEYQLFWNGSQWVNQDLTNAAGSSHLPASGSSLTGFSLSDGTEHTFYIGTDQHVYQMLRTGSAYQNQDLTIINALDLADGPCAFEGGTCFGSSTPQTVAFGANGAYLSVTAPGNISCTPATFGGDPNSGASEACYLMNSFTVAFAGTSLTSFQDSTGAHVYYVDSHDHVHQLFWAGATQSNGGPWSDQDETSIANPSQLTTGGALAGFPTSSDQQAHAVFLGISGNHVYETVFVGSQMQEQDLTNLSGATVGPVSGSALTAFGLSAGNPGHIQYLDSNGHVNHLYFDGSAWHNQDLNSVTSGTITVFDSGTVSLTAAGLTATACFGASTNPACTGQQGNNTASQVASALAQALNVTGSPVTASTSGATITLTSNGTLASSSVTALSTTHDNSALFTTPSFTSPATTLSGGGDPSPTVNPYVTTYTYNVLDQLTGSSAAGQSHSEGYDALGRMTSQTTPEAGTVIFQYNDFNLLTQRTDQRGVITSYTYDGLNRLTGKSYTIPNGSGIGPMPNNICDPSSPTGTNLVANTCLYYDQGGSQAFALGRLTSEVDASGSEANTYDQLGRTTQKQKIIAGSTYPIAYQYNLANEITQVQYPSGRKVKPSFDGLGRLAGISDTLGSTNTTYATNFSYNAAQQLTGFNYGNGITAAYGFSSDRLQLTSISYATSMQTLFSLNYNYGSTNNGQIATITDNVDNGRTTNYFYDALGRLQQATTVGSSNYPKWDLAFGFDRYGNRLTQIPLADTSPNAQAPSNQVTVSSASNQITTTGYSYDASGNMTNDGLNTMTYDGENHAVSSTGMNGGAAYVYDGSGFRVKKCFPSCSGSNTSTVYVSSGGAVIAEYDNGAAPGSPSREYINGIAGLLATIDSTGVKYHLRDHLSVRVSTDTNGNKLGEQGNFPFGEAWYSTNTTTKWRFASYERDSTETGNDYAQARYYINRLARFNSPDPFAGSFALPQSLNRYAYVRNDPINLTDPRGLLIEIPGGGGFDICDEFPEFCIPLGGPTCPGGVFIDGVCQDGIPGPIDPGQTGGSGANKKPPAKLNIQALIDCIFAQFGVTLLDFEPSQLGDSGNPSDNVNGYFAGVGPVDISDIVDERLPITGLITVTNDIQSMSADAITTDAKFQHQWQEGDSPFHGETPYWYPYINYTANDLIFNRTALTVQIWELGNSLAVITGLDNTNEQQAQQLDDCYKNGGPSESGSGGKN